MKRDYRTAGCYVLLITALAGTAASCARPAGNQTLFSGSVDTNTSLRLFYFRGDYFHPPLLFRAVGDKDPRLNTAPIFDEGRTVYISLKDMREVVRILANSALWQTTRKVEDPRPSMELEMPPDGMEIVLFLSTGTARTLIAPARLCATLAPVDTALRKRALWEFRLFRVQYDCTVPGFDRNAYPEHDVGERTTK